MGIWDRLGSVIKSYFNDDEETVFANPSKGHASARHGDPDLDAAYDELNDFLNGKEKREKAHGFESKGGKNAAGEKQKARPVPANLHKDFEALGLNADAGAEECKEAYKKLLKKYHPDRHAQTPENLIKATQKTAEINAAYDRLEEWFKSSS